MRGLVEWLCHQIGQTQWDLTGHGKPGPKTQVMVFFLFVLIFLFAEEDKNIYTNFHTSTNIIVL